MTLSCRPWGATGVELGVRVRVIGVELRVGVRVRVRARGAQMGVRVRVFSGL